MEASFVKYVYILYFGNMCIGLVLALGFKITSFKCSIYSIISMHAIMADDEE